MFRDLKAAATAAFDDQSQHIACIIAAAKMRGLTKVQPTPEAQQALVGTTRKSSVVNCAYG